MGKVPVRLREVVYTLSPNQQSIMSGLFKDAGYKAAKYFKMHGLDIIAFGVLPVYAVGSFTDWWTEAEKQAHRY